MKRFIPALLCCFYFACTSTSENTSGNTTDDHPLNDLFERIDTFESSSQDSLYRGMHPKGAWQSITYEAQQARIDQIRSFLKELDGIDDSTLDEQEVISKKVMKIRLQNWVDDFDFKLIYIPFNAEGGFYNSMAYILPNLHFETTEDYQGYLRWLPHYHNQLRENIELVRQGMEAGIVAPKIVVKNNIQLLKPWLDVQNTVLYEPIKKLDQVIDTENTELKTKLEVELAAIGDTFKDFNQLLKNEYMAAAKEMPGISEIPNGKAYYENRVRHYTTLPLSPDSVHNLGLSEVARIRKAMEDIIEEVEFDGTFDEFLTYLRTDERFYAKTPQELLNYAAWLSKKAEGELPKFFNELYKLPFTVEPVPESIAPTYTTGRYVGGSWETKRAGIYWVNTYNLPSRTLYTLPALTLHEAVPGHHLQNAIAAELTDIPEFRNNYYISAFGEGWGLYSEYLGEEMGMYENPYHLFGRYTYEMWRACRLVVDTGMHYKGWTREQALDFMASNTALSIHEVTTEIDRYIGWPGQALSYKVGEIKIKQLRQMAENELGDAFNIGEFHHTLLKNGSVPLEVLEEQVVQYINETKSSE